MFEERAMRIKCAAKICARLRFFFTKTKRVFKRRIFAARAKRVVLFQARLFSNGFTFQNFVPKKRRLRNLEFFFRAPPNRGVFAPKGNIRNFFQRRKNGDRVFSPPPRLFPNPKKDRTQLRSQANLPKSISRKVFRFFAWDGRCSPASTKTESKCHPKNFPDASCEIFCRRFRSNLSAFRPACTARARRVSISPRPRQKNIRRPPSQKKCPHKNFSNCFSHPSLFRAAT